MFKAILIFVLLWSTAMADLKKRNKKLAAEMSEGARAEAREDKAARRVELSEELRRVKGLAAKTYKQKENNYYGYEGILEKYGDLLTDTQKKAVKAKIKKYDDQLNKLAKGLEWKTGKAHEREMNVIEDEDKRAKVEDLLTRWFKSKGKKVPSFKKGKGFVTSRFRQFLGSKRHKKYGAIDFDVAGLGTKADQQDFINFAIQNGATVIDEKFAISQKRKTGDRNVFHVDFKPGGGKLIQEIPQGGTFQGDNTIPRNKRKWQGPDMGHFTTVKPGEESYGGFIAPGASTRRRERPASEVEVEVEVDSKFKIPKKKAEIRAWMKKNNYTARDLEKPGSLPGEKPKYYHPGDVVPHLKKPEDKPGIEQTEREIIEETIKKKPLAPKKKVKPLIEDTGDASYAEEVYRRDQQRDLGSIRPGEFGVGPEEGNRLSPAEVKSINADEPAQLMNMQQQIQQPEQTEDILDVSVSQMGVQPAAAPPINQPGFEGAGEGAPGQLTERPTMVAKKGGEVKEYQLGDMVEGPQMLTKGEAGGDIDPRESEVGIEGAPKGAQEEVTQEQIEEVKEKFPEEVNKLASMPSAQEGMQQEAVTGLDQDIYQKDTVAIQSHLDDIRSGRNVEEARAALAQYPVEQLAEFRDVRTSPAVPLPGAQTPPDRLELQKAQGQAKQLAAQSAVGIPNPETLAQTMQLQKQEQQAASSGIDQLMQQDLELKKRLNEELDRSYQAEKDIRKVEPNQFFHSMSTPAKIAASIGMLVAGFGSQTAQGVQSAYNIMNAAIQQDMDNQKLDREHQLIVAKEARSRAQDAINKYSKLAMRPETKAKLMELKQKLEQDKNLLEAAKQKEVTKKLILNGISTGKIAHLKPWMRDFLYNKEQQKEQFKLRQDYDKEVKDTKASPIVSAYRKLHSLVHNNPNPGGQGDIAIVFSFMKMLDPNSVVREGEFKTAENATPRAVQFARAWNKFFNGGRFVEADRKKFVDTTRLIVEPALADLKFVKDRYVKISQRYGYPPSLIVGPSVSWANLPGGKRELRIQKRMKKDGLTRKEAEAIDKIITKR